jgi:hypothetical protein
MEFGDYFRSTVSSFCERASRGERVSGDTLPAPLIICNSGSRVDTVAAVQQMALVTSEPLPWVNKP